MPLIHFIPKHCRQCGAPLELRRPEFEDRDRLVCPACGFIAYTNPLLVAGAVPEDRDGILLLRRGIEPARGSWTFPAGFVELGETVAEAAVRETREEIGVTIRITGLLGVYSYAETGVVTVVYRAKVEGGVPAVSREAEAVAKFSAGDIPWKEVAFRSTRDALKDWTARS
ncbi:MAG: hypothetical protein A2902_01025 [Elusimicrobia bacterium RIFCSPLOWO2_01_FULL_64_13]|nr:MAG: hypothetical protein A2636_03485 [Elusimicrobia bacterium RIFCSPHIGHO2_01_FULL_64_10]OGR97918.1 MAG: hypothetical protein A2902_01025 [Elusimicrobia bacterium RIFCSPLOWO2_01_FULL_64_13]